MLDKTTTRQATGIVVTCADYDQFVETMFGPQQHDHHMRPYRAEWTNKANRRAREILDAQIAAAGSVTAWLRGTK